MTLFLPVLRASPAYLDHVPAARSRRVLVVDDNIDAGDTMAALVAAWGHTAAVARNATEALAVSAHFNPDTALVDIGLPE